MKEETEIAMIGSFVKMVNEVELDDAIDVVRVTCDILSNTLGCAVVRKLSDCDCPPCRRSMATIVENVMKQLRHDVEHAINHNMIKLDIKEPLFGPTDHNTQIAEEIKREIKKGI